MSKQYCYSFDGYYYESDLFDTKEEAIEGARKEAKETETKCTFVYLGIANKYEEDCDGLADSISEILQERAINECGEFAEDYMNIYNKDHLNILNERLKQVVLDFQKEFNYKPGFYTVSDVEVINL